MMRIFLGVTLDPVTGEVLDKDIKEQTRACIRKMQVCLAFFCSSLSSFFFFFFPLFLLLPFVPFVAFVFCIHTFFFFSLHIHLGIPPCALLCILSSL